MENKNRKCSLGEHSKINAKTFCQDCKILMCDECEDFHKEICETHRLHKLDKNIINIKDLLDQAMNLNEINFFCKTHNKFCYRKCKAKSKEEENDKINNCNVCLINYIEEDKRNELKNNIKDLEFLLNHLEDNANKLKEMTEIIYEKKENLKVKIQKIFTKIRNAINDREEELFLEIDKNYDDLFFEKDIIKNGEKLSSIIKKQIEKAKLIDNQWDNTKLKSLVNDCLTFENNIKEINEIKENVAKFNVNNIDLTFSPEENEINYFLNEIKKFGKTIYNKYSFKKCPINIKEERKYIVTGEKQNIFTKIGTDYCWMGILCEKPLNTSKEEYKWKIKILNTYNNNIMVGIATIDFDINSSSYDINKNCGWYYNCINGTLYSGSPHNYQGKCINLMPKNNEITVIMNMKKKSLKFINEKEDKGESYTNIPLDKPIFPSILLRDICDSVEIIEIN